MNFRFLGRPSVMEGVLALTARGLARKLLLQTGFRLFELVCPGAVCRKLEL